MEADGLFQLVNATAMIAWLLLIIIPNTKITRILVKSGIVLLFLGGVYAILILSFFNMENMQDFSTLDGVMSLFRDPMGVVAGWTHYLAFDLFVGMWITADGANSGVNRWWLLPCQLLTFMFGPMGFLCYYAVRFFVTKSVSSNLMGDA
jgi:hypothetical protein